jgi:DNA polymerase III subunit delta'
MRFSFGRARLLASPSMPIVPLYGHQDLQRRFREAITRQTFPASLLLQGPRGTGKQRLAVWIGQILLCETADAAPCGVCQSCRFSSELRHPDLHWYFPRPRLKDSDPDLADVREDYEEAIGERVRDSGLYAAPSGSDGLFVATVRAIVQQAVMSPAMARRKVFVIGDAERMVPQEGSDQAANAFLKLLEEPSADTTIILTSSEPGALLPTIRSRVVSFRVAPLSQDDLKAFLADKLVASRLAGESNVPKAMLERVAFAGGAPGRLLSGALWTQAIENAERLLESATGKPLARYEAAWQQASSKARGSFADTLDALTVALHHRARAAVERGSIQGALGAAKAMDAVETAKERVDSNVSPQLITVNLLRELQEILL